MSESHVKALASEGETLAWGAQLGRALRVGDVVCLDGGLGAGKTTLARGIVRAWVGDEGADVPSPTFTLAQIYDGPQGALWHMDLYRLKQPEEALEIGLEEALSGAVCLIEWPSRLGALLPADRIELAFSGDGEARRVLVRGFGAGVRRVEELMDA